MKDRVNAQKILDGSDLIKKKKSEMEHQKVWVPDPVEGFVLGVIQDISSDEATVMTVKDRKTVKVSYDSIYPSGELINRDFEDNCSLMYLNEGSLLNNLRIRYEKDQIYTYVANILIAINPYFDISNLYSSSFIEKYQGKSLGLLPPHLFALADKSLRDLKVLKQNQSIIVSGESGSGKTESTKYVLRYLCSNQHTKGSANKSDQTGRIENLILEANPVLEAFANAKTQRNNNSSRFGKFIEIHFDHKIHIVGGHISHYLLEKSRIITQSREERNYHIFYQLIAGLSKKDLDKLHLTKPEDYNYLRNGCTRYFGETAQYTDKTRCSKEQLQKGSIKDPIVNDLKNFKGLEKAFANFGVDEELKFSIFRIVAGVLHLGNIDFEEDPQDTRGGCRIAASAEDSLRLAASLIKIEPTSLRQCLLTRIMQTSKGNVKGTVYLVPLKQAECRNARDALSKTLYSRLFDYIVGDIINKSLPFFESSYYIGALDIAGFEFFETNCFEQFNINYCNERLQQFFNERILKEEQRIYESECLQLKQIDFQDNTDCLQLIERPNTGILALLDEESKLPKSSPFHFTEQVHLSNKNHFNLQIPRKSDLKIYRNLRDDEGFIVRHFAGAVCYQTKHFLMKNNDALHNSLQCLMLESADELIKTLFTSGSPNSNAQNGKLQLCSVSMKFKQQLAELMEKLNSTGTHFIRCIKPNSNFAKHSFAGANVLSQLRCSGMKSVMELMHQGYPSRTSFAELYNMYEKYLPANLRRLEPRMFSKILFKAIGLNQNDYKFGLTKVFFKAGKFAEFDQLIKADPEHLRKLISKVQKFLIITRWKMSSWCALSVIKLKNKIKYRAEKIVQIQAHLRMCSAIVRYRPLVKGLQGLRKLLTINEDLLGKTGQLKDANERSQMESQLARLKAELGQFQNVLRANQIPSENNKGIQQRYSLRREFVDQKLSEFRDQLDDMVGVFKRKMNKQAELDQMQKKLEEEQRKLEEEERKRAEEEEKRRKREEMEARRLKEEQEMNRRDELARQEQAMKQEQLVRREQTPAQYGGATASSSSGYRINHQPGAAGYFELTDDIISEDNLQRKRLEQEKLDHDLAMRLASEMDRKHLEQQFMQNMRSSSAHQPPPVANNVPPPLQVSSDHLINGLRNIQLKPGQELDLSKWKYSELRDVINTSCDLFLLECCKKEFHRRLKVYHQWKMRNNQMQGQTYEQRAPDSIMKSQNLHPTSNGVSANFNPSKEQRYFRVPFMKSNNLSGEKGFWYSHFDGSYIARQMEIHPNKQPLLLRAGVNDMQMCELSLEETRLTSKRGAEILADEFEAEWIKNGGEPWTDRSRK